MHNVIIESDIHIKLLRLIKMCLNETIVQSPGRKFLSDVFPIKNGYKEKDVLSPLFFNFALGYAFKMVQTNQYGLKLNGTHQVLVYVDDVNVLGENTRTVEGSTEVFQSMVRRYV